MARTSFDRQAEAAESALDRIDDRRGEAGAADLALEAGTLVLTDDLHDHGLHVDDGAGAPDDDDLELIDLVGPEVDGELADVIDAFSEAFNARDLDELVALVTDDCETPGLASGSDDFPAAIDDLWHRRPSCLLARGQLDDECLAVLFELEGAGRWWRVATVHFCDVVDGQAGVIEFSDDPALLEEVDCQTPDLDLDEGALWQEWEDGG